MSVSITFDHLDESQREAHRAIEQALSDGAVEAQATAQFLAPVDTGRLRASISTRDAGPLNFEVYTDVNYAVYQEYGTRYQPGKAFMRPSYERHRIPITESCARALQTL